MLQYLTEAQTASVEQESLVMPATSSVPPGSSEYETKREAGGEGGGEGGKEE